MVLPQAGVSLWNIPYDNELLLADGVAAITPTAGGVAGVVAGSAKVLDLGPGQVCGTMVVVLQALDVGTGDELYVVQLQGADDSAFSSGKRTLATLLLGHTAKTGSSASDAAGTYHVPFRNEVYRAGSTPKIPARYVRTLVQTPVGTIAANSFDYIAFLSIDRK